MFTRCPTKSQMVPSSKQSRDQIQRDHMSRERLNPRVVAGWIEDVVMKMTRQKQAMLLRHKQESYALRNLQFKEWTMKLKVSSIEYLTFFLIGANRTKCIFQLNVFQNDNFF